MELIGPVLLIFLFAGLPVLALGLLTGWRNPYPLPRAPEPLPKMPDPWEEWGRATLRAQMEFNARCRRRRVRWPAEQWQRV